MQFPKLPIVYAILFVLGPIFSANALDVSDAPRHYSVAAIAQAHPPQRPRANKERAIGVCYGVDYNKTGRENVSFLSPGFSADGYFVLYENRSSDPWKVPSRDVALVVKPKHGKLDYTKREDELFYPVYIPSPGYVGDEKIVFKVNVDGTIVRVVYLLKVTKMFADAEGVHDLLCRKTGTQWKISSVLRKLGDETLILPL